MSARLTAFAVWALVAAGAVFWGLRLGTTPLAAPAGTPTVADAPRSGGDLSRLLGAAPAVPVAAPAAESSRFRLVGVIADARMAGDAPGGAQRGVALLAIDGKPPRPFRVGTTVDGSLALLTVSRRAAQLGPRGGPASVSLELPPPQPPATGMLPRMGLDGLPMGGVPPFPNGVPPSANGVPLFPGAPSPGNAPPPSADQQTQMQTQTQEASAGYSPGSPPSVPQR